MPDASTVRNAVPPSVCRIMELNLHSGERWLSRVECAVEVELQTKDRSHGDRPTDGPNDR